MKVWNWQGRTKSLTLSPFKLILVVVCIPPTSNFKLQTSIYLWHSMIISTYLTYVTSDFTDWYLKVVCLYSVLLIISCRICCRRDVRRRCSVPRCSRLLCLEIRDLETEPPLPQCQITESHLHFTRPLFIYLLSTINNLVTVIVIAIVSLISGKFHLSCRVWAGQSAWWFN